jgi:hypothetical protein
MERLTARIIRPRIERRINEMKLDTSVALKAGLIGAGLGLVVAVLGRIPFLGCISCFLGPLAALVTGALYVQFATGKVELADGALGGAVAGAISGAVNSLFSGLMNLIFGTAQAASDLLGGEFGAAALTAGASVGSVLVGIVVGAIVGAVLGLVGGIIYAAIKK